MKQQIVVVDDDPRILHLMQHILESAGYHVHTAYDGSYFQQMPDPLPDLILLDISLKEEDGRVICRRLKSSERTRRLPIILFSAHHRERHSCEMAQADGFLEKPFHLQQVLDLVAHLLAPQNTPDLLS